METWVSPKGVRWALTTEGKTAATLAAWRRYFTERQFTQEVDK